MISHRPAITFHRVTLAFQPGRATLTSAMLGADRQAQQVPRDDQLLKAPDRLLAQRLGQAKHRLNVTFDVEIVVQVGLGQTHLCAWQEHHAQRAGVLEHNGGCAWCLVRPGCAVPQADSDVLHRLFSDHPIQQAQGQTGRFVP